MRRILAGARERDTDADWRAIGAREPYWGVLVNRRFKRENLTPKNLERFYASGRRNIAMVLEELSRLAGAPVRPLAALDVGCGVGRLSEAMTERAAAVTGYDISPGMLQEARARGGGRVRYVDRLPDETFDWINSYIVLQHVPPRRGLALLEELLRRLSPGGFLSLQLTVWREPPAEAPVPPGPVGTARRWLRRVSTAVRPVGTMMIYDYDLGAVCRVLHRHEVHRLTLLHTDHGGHHGVLILGARGEGPWTG